MTQDGDKLFAQFIVGMGAAQCRLVLLPRHFTVELHCNESGKAREHAQDFGVSHLGGRRINSTEIAKVAAIRQNNWYRNVALYLVELRRVVVAVTRVGARL